MVKKLSKSLTDKYNKLQTEIKAKKKLLIAFSGGVDSALLSFIAHEQLGDNSWAVLVDSETVPKFELTEARKLADKIGISFNIVRTNQLSDEDFVKNEPSRCYYCRNNMAKQLKAFAKKKGIKDIAAGAQASDLTDFRPGIKAFHNAGIWHPFIELKFTKDDIRRLARHLELPVADKPSMACLSSRFPYGQRLTKEQIKMAAAAEDYLRELGFSQYRARTCDKTLRLEVNDDDFNKIIRLKNQIVPKMKALGYVYVTLDLEGFRSGSMNEVLTEKDME